ncbi:hypothetical protein [Halalkalibacter krulwichiae]|nr:hypothetical protein [Halalkalibacter krulwichiae]
MDKKLTIYYPIEQYKEYAELIETHLSKKSQWFADEAKKLSPEEYEEFETFYSDDWYNHRFVYSQTHRKSLFNTIYSFLEKTLLNICQKQDKSNKSLVKYSDINGKGIDKSRTYLTKVIGINIPQTDWEILKSYQSIRNSLAHNDGENISQNDKIPPAIRKVESIRIENDRIKLDPEACEKFLDKIENFLSNIHDQCYSTEKE